MNKKLLLQHLLPHHFLSWCCGIFVTRRWKRLKNWQINTFLRKYPVDLRSAEKETVTEYATFNDFFTRTLKTHARPIDKNPRHLVSPADGSIVQLGKIEQGALIQAKGQTFQLDSLVGSENATPFLNGNFINIYLSPTDYHRVHMPFDGKIVETAYFPGKLFSVNPNTTIGIPNLFPRNERLVCVIETSVGKMLLVMVGAMLVNGIVTNWAGKVTPFKQKEQKPLSISYQKGDEIAHFQFGSTVILILPEACSEWTENCKKSSHILMGAPFLVLSENH